VRADLSQNDNSVAEALGMTEAPILRAATVCESGLAFLELNCNRQNAGFNQTAQDDAYLIALQLKDCHDFDLFAGERFIQPQQFDAGAVAIFDLRSNLATDLRDPFHAIDLYLPLRALKSIAEELGVPAIEELHYRPGTAVIDPVAHNLLLSMRPALAAQPAETPGLFVDHMALALTAHIVSTYGGVHLPSRVSRGGLAPWQERRAKELLDANLAGKISLSQLASECEVSVRHFTRGFRQSTGMTPHEWLLRQRIERAKSLLVNTSDQLTDVALNCGFADQSHFSRAFVRAIGVTPGKWRRFKRS
jgi:AraC family transcriptional regulator